MVSCRIFTKIAQLCFQDHGEIRTVPVLNAFMEAQKINLMKRVEVVLLLLRFPFERCVILLSTVFLLNLAFI